MLLETVRAVCGAAGWSIPPADAEGRYFFSLEGGLDFSLSSPDGDRLLAHAVLAVPTEDRGLPDDLAAFVLSATAGRFARMRAVPALDPRTGALVLYRFTDLKEKDRVALKKFVEAFLNDLAFWKAQPALAAT
jgi:hypothetical protein